LQPPEYFNVGDNVKWSPFSPHFVTFLVSSLGYSLDTLKHTLNSSNKHQNHFQRKLELKIEPLLSLSRTLFVYSNSTSYVYLLEQFRDKSVATTWKPVHLQKCWFNQHKLHQNAEYASMLSQNSQNSTSSAIIRNEVENKVRSGYAVNNVELESEMYSRGFKYETPKTTQRRKDTYSKLQRSIPNQDL